MEAERRPSLPQVGAALLLLGAAAIHAAQIRVHFEEWPAAGIFFVALTLAQGVTGVVLLRLRSRPLCIAAIGVSVVAVAVWMVSRTSGMPFGPFAGSPEPAGRADLAATLFEALTIVALLAVLRSEMARRWAVAGRLGWAGTVVLAAAVVGATGFAMQPTAAHHHGSDGHEETGGHHDDGHMHDDSTTDQGGHEDPKKAPQKDEAAGHDRTSKRSDNDHHHDDGHDHDH